MEVNFGLKSQLNIVFTPDKKKDKAVHLLKISTGSEAILLLPRIPVACISLDK